MNFIYDLIETFFIKIADSEYDEETSSTFKNCELSIRDLVKDLRIKYSKIVEVHSVFIQSKTSQKTIYSFFDPIIEKAFFFKDLYKITYELSIIDDTEVSINTFQNIFTEPIPKEKIQFTCNSSIISYYFDSLQCFFKQLTPNKIEESEVFLSKQGKTITKQNLYTSKERGKGKYLDFKDRIDEQIEILKSTYLK